MKKLIASLLALTFVVAVAAGCAEAGKKGGAQTVKISVTEDGFVPAKVKVKKDQPVVLVVTRKTERTCATELVMPAQNINQKLPLNEAVEIRFTPTESGELGYACAMDMIKGSVVVN